VAQTPSQVTPPEESVGPRSQTRSRKRVAYALGLTFAGWLGVGLLVASALVARQVLSIVVWTAGASVVFAVWRLASAVERGADASAPAEPAGVGRLAWFAVGCFPAAFVAGAIGTGIFITGNWYAALTSVFSLFMAVTLGAPLLSGRAREIFLRQDRASSLLPLVAAIASVDRGSTETTVRRRQRLNTIGAIEALLFMIALAIAGFVGLLTYLTVKHWGVHLTGRHASAYGSRKAAAEYVIWQSLDLVPFLNIPKTLNWSLHRTFTDPWSGGILLALKLFIVLPVVKTAADLARAERPTTSH
jgi:hypothetical protein